MKKWILVAVVIVILSGVGGFAVYTLNPERVIGKRLAKESYDYVYKTYRGSYRITEVPPGKNVWGAPDAPRFEWKPAMSNIRKNRGRENMALYVEYNYIDSNKAPHHLFLMHSKGVWQVIAED